VVFSIRLVIEAFQLFFVILQLWSGASKLGTFRKIGREKCADSLTNQFFIDTDTDVRKYVVTWNLIVALWLGIGMLTEIILELVVFGKCFKSKNKYSNYSSYATKNKEEKKLDISRSSASSDDNRKNRNADFPNGNAKPINSYNHGRE
jgi:hypothetical protein